MLRKRADRSMADLICGAESSTSSISSFVLLVRFQPFLERRDLVARPGEQLRAAQAAARLDELRGFEIQLIHDEAGGELEERRALVGPRDEDARHAESARADVELRPDARAQRRRQTRIRPDFSPRRDCRDAASGAPKGSSESITRPRSGYFSETARSDVSWLVSPLKTTLNRPVLRATSRPRRRASSHRLVVHHLAGLQPQVRGEHFARLVVDRDADAIDEEAHARERRHRHRDREDQHAELARLPFAHQTFAARAPGRSWRGLHFE